MYRKGNENFSYIGLQLVYGYLEREASGGADEAATVLQAEEEARIQVKYAALLPNSKAEQKF